MTTVAKEAGPRRPSTSRNEGWREEHPSSGCSFLEFSCQAVKYGPPLGSEHCTYYNCCWILQVAASKRRAAYLSMNRACSADHNLTGHGGGRLHAAFLPGRALCAVFAQLCCCLTYLGFPTQKLCVFGSVFTCKFE